MRVVFSADNPIEAHLVRHALEDAGLMVFVLGEHLYGAMGELPAGGLLQVCVPEPQLDAAQAVLRELPLAAGEPRTHDAVDDEGPLPDTGGLGLA